MNRLSTAGLADLTGVTEAEVGRLVDLGILVPRDGTDPFLETDAQKVRLATACEQAGLPMAGIAAAIRAGRLSFAFLEAAPYRRWAVRKGRTYQQVSQETGVPLELLGSALEAMGYARMAPDEPMREDALEIVPLLQLGLATGILDQLWSRPSSGRRGSSRPCWRPAPTSTPPGSGPPSSAATSTSPPWSTARCWLPTAASRSCPGPRAWSRRSRRRWRRPAGSGGPGGCRRCASWIWW